MAAPTIFEDVTDDLAIDGGGQLFAGKKFWVAQRVPLRNQLLDNIKANGGDVVMLEKKADYLIADHKLPRFCPPGSLSYKFIEESIKDGQLCDPQHHLAGPPVGEAREAGAIDRPTKGGRTAFTTEDDNVLLKWVRDCMAAGMPVGGNTVYQELEKKNPRHTWQSWRDRYVKQLKHRHPDSFNIPAEPPTANEASTPPAEPTAAASKRGPSKVSGEGKLRASKTNVSPEYTIEQLNATFSAEDWEELYAAVEQIDSVEGEERDNAWTSWAEAQNNQTVEQWRQYYDKVVRPSWLHDPEWKREHVRAKVEKRRTENAGSQASQEEDDQEEAEPPEETTPAEHNPVQATVEPQAAQPKTSASDVKMMSSSTAQYESPKHISNLYQNALKRVRGGGAEQEHAQDSATDSLPRPSKRQKSQSPSRNDQAHSKEVSDANQQLFEVFSSESDDSEDKAENEQVNEQIMQDMERSQPAEEVAGEDEDIDDEVESVETEDVLELNRIPPSREGMDEISDDDLPPNTPTPRASRRPPKNNFDTQAILSSPSQALNIGKLPRPQSLHNEAERSSSLAPHAESDASTTQSLHEFRRSLNNEDIAQLNYPTLPAPQRQISPSPTPSDASTSSADRDPPLNAAEMNEFFTDQLEEGFHNDFIVKALMRTRFRPELAKDVLEAWRQGKPLPDQRGIWSLEDDEAVESGDGLALAKLERKHSLDGWGGITERLRFLEGYRSR